MADDQNPYQAPAAGLDVGPVFTRSIWWKLYFFAITLLSALGVLLLLIDLRAGAAEYLTTLSWLLSTVGLFGFVFLKPIFVPAVWLWVLIMNLLVGMGYEFVTDIDHRAAYLSDSAYFTSIAFNWILSLPGLYALYAYSRPGDPAWQQAAR